MIQPHRAAACYKSMRSMRFNYAKFISYIFLYGMPHLDGSGLYGDASVTHRDQGLEVGTQGGCEDLLP